MEEIFSRRSVRKFLDKPVEQEKVTRLLAAAMQAPSAGNQQPWEFIVVREKENLEKLGRMSPYAGPAGRAPLAIVLVSETSRMKYPEYAAQDMAAAAENLLTEAVHLGLGAVWMGVYPLKERMERISADFCLPDHLQPFCVIAAGYPADDEANRFIDRFVPARVHYESY